MWQTLERDSGWFGLVPAYRLATFRIMIATITIMEHIPQLDRFILRYSSSSFHLPMVAWLPSIPWKSAWIALILLQHIAAWALFIGILPRLAAGFLAASGIYVFLLDTEHFAHNIWFHLNLLVLLAFSSERLSFPRLLKDDNTARCPAWPERLIRLQLSIVMFYAALDKIFSPFWGLTGGILAHRPLDHHAPPLNWIQGLNRTFIDSFPGVASIVTITQEFFLAFVFLYRPLWHIAVLLLLGFALLLEFMLTPGVFVWDIIAILILFLPANDQSYTVMYDKACPYCRWNQQIISRLDWLRRLRWVSIEETERTQMRSEDTALMSLGKGLYLIEPSGRVRQGLMAFRSLLVLFPAPLYIIFAAIRFGGVGSTISHILPAQDFVFLTIAGFVLLWVPGVARLIGKILYPWLAYGFSRISQNWGRFDESKNPCTLHSANIPSEP